MALEPIRVSQWQGLNLAADPGDAGLNRAISLQNVELDLNGTIRTRPGFDQADATARANPVWLIHDAEDPETPAVTLLQSTEIVTWNAATLTSVGTATGYTGATHIVRGFIADYGGSDIVSGGGVEVNDLPAKFLAIQPVDDRLVAGYAGRPSASSDRVHFSNPGAAVGDLTFGTDDWVDIAPGRGAIRMVVSWENLLFVFKDNLFAVFYGNSTDSSGGAVFNYRMVDTGIGASYDYAACAAQDGVYFVNRDGVYRTTGGKPELVSAALQPFFDERSNGFFAASGPLSSPRIHAGEDRLYVWQAGSTGMFVMDLRSREWTYWVLGVAPAALLPMETPREVVFVSSTGQLYHLAPDYTDDNGTDIASHYQSGYGELAEGAKVRVRRFLLEGSGTVNHATAADYGTAGTAASVTMGTAPAVALSYDTRSAQCRGLSFKVSATSGAWSLNRWTALLADRRGHR